MPTTTVTNVKPDRNQVLDGTGAQWTVTDLEDGKKYPVHIRVDVVTGSTAYLYTKKGVDVSVSVVLATVSPSGETIYGGSGDAYSSNDTKSVASYITTSEDAKTILGTGRINDQLSTVNQQLDAGRLTAQKLVNAANSNNTTANQNLVAGQTNLTNGVVQLEVEEFAEPYVVVEGQAELIGAAAEVVAGESPLNNDLAATGAESIGAQLASAAGDPLKDIVKFAIEKGKEVNSLIKLSDAEIAKFNQMFEDGGGDKIEGAKYPFDANYGDIRGQDYVTIDQFIYEPPRRDQILGTGGINPVSNLISGQQRISSLKKFVAMVKLPMPNNITDSNNISWGDDAMNNLSAALTASVMKNPAAGAVGGVLTQLGLGPIGTYATLAASLFDNPGITNPDGSQNRSLQGLSQGAAKIMQQEGIQAAMKTNVGASILGMLNVNVTPESLLARGFGVIPNSNSELLFNNVTLRDFQFSWRMSPRDEKEALEVKRIIRFFKQGMAAKTMANQAGQRSLYLGTPNIFRLQYRTAGGQIIEGVNRIKPCAVTGTAVNYTPDGQWSAYNKGQPVSCVLSIQMKELEPVYATDYSQDVIKSRRSGPLTKSFEETETVFDGGNVTSETRTFDIPTGQEGDLYKIRPTEVGY